MNKMYSLLLMFIALSCFATHAQVNGLASDPVISTESDTVYFYLESASDGSYSYSNFTGDFRGNVMISPDAAGKLIHNTLETAPSPEHAQWAIIMIDGVATLQNKATKLFMTASHSCKAEPTKYIYTSIGNNQFVMRTSDQPSYTITWKNNQLDRLNIGLNQNSLVAWYFIPADVAQLNDILKLSLQGKLDAGRSLLANTGDGSDFGQYSTENREAFEAELDNGQLVYDQPNVPINEIQSAIFYVDQAKVTFMSTINLELSALTTENPDNYRWYWIRSYATGEDYCFNKVISSEGKITGEKFTYTEKEPLPAEKQLFRFELTEDKQAVAAIVNYEGKYMVPNGAISDTLYTRYTFSFDPQPDGIAFWIDPAGPTELAPLRANPGGPIDNWKYLVGGASSWVFDFAYEGSKIPRVSAERSVAVSSGQPIMGSAIVTETGASSITTDIESVSVTAIPYKGYFFTKWTTEGGDSLSTNNPYIYKGAEAVTLLANFENGYYKPMSRFFTGSEPTIQVADRYLIEVTAIVGEEEQQIVSAVDTIPNPVDTLVLTNQLVHDALVDYTAVPVVLKLETDSFQMKFVGSSASIENLKWTQQAVFVDWDKDFYFTGEGEASTRSIESGGDARLSDPEGYVSTIFIPEGLQEAVYRMRVVYNEPAGSADWTTSIWKTSTIRNGVAFDFNIRYGAPNKVENAHQNNVKAFVSAGKLMVLNGQNSRVNVYDATGKSVVSAAINSDVQSLNLPATSGLFIVKLVQANGNLISIKVLR